MNISIIGAGAMGGAIAEGLVKVGQHSVTVSDPSEIQRQHFAQLGVATTTDNCAAARTADLLFVVVKPWFVESVITDLASNVDLTHKTLVLVAAGIKGEQLQTWAGAGPELLLCIPNIAIAQLASMTFLTPVRASETITQQVKSVLDTMGQTIITDAAHLPAGTTLASCGIAYAMRYIRAASEGGVELGFKAHEAQQIVMQTMLGAVQLLQASKMHPEAAIDLVTTPGGITIKGLNAMEQAGFTNSVIRGLLASMKDVSL